jgi:hypothetical protein
MVSTAGGSSPSTPSFGVRKRGVLVLGTVAKNLLAARPADVKGWFWVHGSNYKGRFQVSIPLWEMAPL